ncbi:MAG: inorganic phosphate transporter [Thermoplasmataceae archaeon]
MIFFIAILVLSGLLSAFVSGNNLSVVVGNIIGSRIVSRQMGLVIGISGFISGLFIEGHLLRDSIGKLMPQSSIFIVFALLVSLFIFIFATWARIPLSLIMALVGTGIGISLRNNYNFDQAYVHLIIFAWILAPVASILLSILLSRIILQKGTKNPWTVPRLFKPLLVIVSFLTAFALGANTLGLIAALTGDNISDLLIMSFGIVFGSVFLSSGVIRRVSQEMYSMRYVSAFVSLLVSALLVESATFFSIPLASTQTLTSSILGSGISYKIKAIFLKPFLLVVAMWIVSPLVGLLLGYAL